MTRAQLDLEVSAGLQAVKERKRAIVGGRECWSEDDVVGAATWAVTFYKLEEETSTEGGSEPVKTDPPKVVTPTPAPKRTEPPKPKPAKPAKPVPAAPVPPATTPPAGDTTPPAGSTDTPEGDGKGDGANS